MSAASAMSARVAVAPGASSLRQPRASTAIKAIRAGTPPVRVRASIEDLPKENKECKVLVVGGTGYIGKFVVRELCARGYDVTALVREKSGIGGKTNSTAAAALFPNATVLFGNVGDLDSIRNATRTKQYDVVVSCLASRTGGIKDSWEIDYGATKNVLDVSVENGAKHFVLLSAICVQKPLLTFQLAKLKLEQDLAATESISHSIVRPTAFFKSLAGQVESVQKGGPYVMFGDGQVRPPGVSQIQRLFTAPFVTVRVYRE